MNANSILNVWDRCVGENQTFKGVALASLASIETNQSHIVDWSIEKRDVALFHVRKALFGSRFNNVAKCPECSKTVEWDVSFNQMGIPNLTDVPDNLKIPVDVLDYKLIVRLPNSNDLESNNKLKIIENCVVNLQEFQGQFTNPETTDILISSINSQFDEICQASNITYHLNCAECGHEWQVLFNIVAYLWKEVDQWAKNFLGQIGLLARAFGWSELDIINMSDNRRNYYLNLLNS